MPLSLKIGGGGGILKGYCVILDLVVPFRDEYELGGLGTSRPYPLVPFDPDTRTSLSMRLVLTIRVGGVVLLGAYV